MNTQSKGRTDTNSGATANQQPSSSMDNDSLNNSQQHNIKYMLKNDGEEIARLNGQHEALKLVWGSLFYSPINEALDKGITVLDSGCGTGCWMLDMSKQYPNSTFNGMDVSPIFSAYNETKPNNCTFDTASVLEPLPYPHNHFDFVHQRLLVAAIPQNSWQSVINNFFHVLKPGGWIEMMETTDVINMSPKGAQLRDCLSASAVKRDIRMSAAREIELYMMNSGFRNIKVVPMLLPFGKSETEDNTASSLFQEDFLRLYKRKAVQALVMKSIQEIKTSEDYQNFLDDVLAEYDKYKTSMLAFRFYGQKPHD